MIKTFLFDIAKGFIIELLIKFVLLIALIGGLWYSYGYVVDYFINAKTEQVVNKISTKLKTEKAELEAKVQVILDSNKTKAVVETTKATAINWFKSVSKTVTKETP